MTDTILLAGFGRADITPDHPVHMQGGNWRGRVSTGVLDPLYATCIAFTVGNQTVLLYTTDLKLVTENFYKVTLDEISAATGVPRNQIFLSATHTHSSVAIRYPWEGVEAYRSFFNAAAVRAAKDALADRVPCTVLTGTAETEGLNFVRHYLMNDGTVAGANFGSHKSGYARHIKEPDRQMQVVQLRRQDKKDILMVSFPCHGTFNGASTLLSADYIGPARIYAEANSDCLFAFFQGTCGDQTPRSHFEGLAIKDYAEHGSRVAQYALDAIASLTPCPTGRIKLSSMLFTAPTNKKKLEKLEEAKAVMELVSTYGAASNEVKEAVKKYHFHSRHEANWIRVRAKAGDEKSMQIGVFSIGELAFVLVPYEMFGDQGRYIKANAPFQTAFIVGCTDSYNYMPTREAFDYDCYESQCSFFERGTAERLAETYVEMLQKLKA